MENRADIIDNLLKQECYIMDYLPERVPKNRDGHFFDVEWYLLNSKKHSDIKNRVVNIILKIMCYYRVSIQWNGWIENPKPEMIEQIVETIMDNHSGTLNCLFPNEKMLLVFDWDCLNLAIYNPPKDTHSLLEKIAFSEGMFWRLSEG